MPNTPKNKFLCPDCGLIDHIEIDGYAFGDRLLEGVMFEVRIGLKGYDVKVRRDAEEYFKSLNQKKWLQEAKTYAEETDLATCPRCHNDIDMMDLLEGLGDQEYRRGLYVDAGPQAWDDRDDDEGPEDDGA